MLAHVNGCIRIRDMDNAINGNGSMIPGAWPLARVLETLEMRNAMQAMRGRPCPVSVSVVRRLQNR